MRCTKAESLADAPGWTAKAFAAEEDLVIVDEHRKPRMVVCYNGRDTGEEMCCAETRERIERDVVAPLVEALEAAGAAFGAFESAILSAQRAYHNYQEWGDDQYGPIDEYRTRFHETIDAALAKHRSGR